MESIIVTISHKLSVINIEMDNFCYTFEFVEKEDDDCQQCSFLKIRCQLSFRHFAKCMQQFREDGKVGYFKSKDKNFDINEFSKKFLQIINNNKQDIQVIIDNN